MQLHPLFAMAALPFASAAAQTYQQEFNAARALEPSDPQASAAGMLRSFHAAVAAGDHEYTSVAGLNACGTLYRQGKTVETGKLAREVITALAPLHDNYPESAALRRVQFFGYMERGLIAEGKIGAAWQANRAAAETLRGKLVAADADGPSITLAEVGTMKAPLRSYGFRVIEREAHLLDLAGRSNEARALLDESAKSFGDDWQTRFDPSDRFYIFKLLSARVELLDFLGEKEMAIQAGEELVAAVSPTGQSAQSHLTLRINLLRNLSQWTGPSQEILDEAREIATRMKDHKLDNHVDRLVAKMEFDLKESREPLAAFDRDILKNQALGDSFEATYAGRDSLFTRAELGDPGLDAEFQALLKTLRGHGNKRGEPSLYRSYGSYLLQQNRPAEAIAMLVESLRMTRGFGWTLHQPNILGMLIDARIACGDPAGARANLTELDAWIANETAAPASRRAGAVAIRASALASLGDESAAREAFRVAREMAADLPAFQRRGMTVDWEENVIQAGKKAPIAIAASTIAPLRLQPLEVSAVAVPGDASKTRFSVFNPTSHVLRGELIIAGPGANQLTGAVLFAAGKPETTLRVPKTITAGGETHIEVSMTAAKGITSATARLAWQTSGQPAGPASNWEVTWSPDATRSVILDASSLGANPFRSVSLFHELAIPAGESLGIPFRLRSGSPLRFEYYDATSHELLAIDANGNGDFSEAGDLHIRGPEGVTAAIFPIRVNARTLTAEIRVFAADGLPLLTTGSTQVLEAEVYRHGKWTKEAEDTLK